MILPHSQLSGATVIGSGCVIGPSTVIVRTPGWAIGSSFARRQSRIRTSPMTPTSDPTRTARRQRDRTARPHRKLRRDQERPPGVGRQGRALQLHRRRRDRRRDEHRRWHRHGQFRRRRQTSDRHRRPCLHWQRHDTACANPHRRRRAHRRRVSRDQRRPDGATVVGVPPRV